LIKNIPISKIRRNESTRELVDIAIGVLNKGLRPHLTTWQAKYRRWYQNESIKDRNKEISPQDLQKTYPDYQDLIKDMGIVNERLMKYRELLRKLAFGE